MCNRGRLGNQMFQYAAIKGIAEWHGYEWCLPAKSVIANSSFHFVTKSDTYLYECYRNLNFIENITSFRDLHEHRTESAFDSDLFYGCPDNVNLVGYFNSEKYFKHVSSSIKEEFRFKDHIRFESESLLNKHRDKSDIASIHVRRTDYNDTNVSLDPSYYARALQMIPRNTHACIFSDDIEWCMNRPEFKGTRFNFISVKNTELELCMQSMCDYHIIANSTYSWWGAWLSDSKKVIAPDKFLNEPNSRAKADFYPSHWDTI